MKDKKLSRVRLIWTPRLVIAGLAWQAIVTGGYFVAPGLFGPILLIVGFPVSMLLTPFTEHYQTYSSGPMEVFSVFGAIFWCGAGAIIGLLIDFDEATERNNGGV